MCLDTDSTTICNYTTHLRILLTNDLSSCTACKHFSSQNWCKWKFSSMLWINGYANVTHVVGFSGKWSLQDIVTILSFYKGANYAQLGCKIGAHAIVNLTANGCITNFNQLPFISQVHHSRWLGIKLQAAPLSTARFLWVSKRRLNVQDIHSDFL